MSAHGSPGHHHAWHLPDGTGLHAPAGELVVDPDAGRLCCHLCGGWFRSLGSHVRTHGHTADSYREELGLCRGEALTQPGLSQTISVRQKVAYATSESLRATLATGHAHARTGLLSDAAQRSKVAAPLSSRARARQDAALERGRRTTEARRSATLQQALGDAGSPDLASFLRHRYQQGASLAQLAAETGLGRDRVRQEVLAAGVTLRGVGHTTATGRRTRALEADAAAAPRVGTDDLVAWLRERRAEGWTLGALGEAVGHSGHWVRWRLQR